jgi:uncharacterized repeat protein (TIGR01451 family)
VVPEVALHFNAEAGEPAARLLQVNGALYGTTCTGGRYGLGSIFKVGADENFVTLHSFAGSDGTCPVAELIVASDGFLYGTTTSAIFPVLATVFRIHPLEAVPLETVYEFGMRPGEAIPKAALIERAAGGLVFYGTLEEGGDFAEGAVFRLDAGVTPAVVDIVHSFDRSQLEGAFPVAPLVEADGVVYGTTSAGGAAEAGTVFELEIQTGLFRTLHDFAGNYGARPTAGLIRHGEYFYGTTSQQCVGVGATASCGTLFRIDPAPDPPVFHTLTNFADEGIVGPVAPLVFSASDDAFYGTAEAGGLYGHGVVFRFDPTGALPSISVRHHFVGNTTGSRPRAGLILVNGTLYGTTSAGGEGGAGTIFRVAIGTVPTDAHVLNSFKFHARFPAAELTLSDGLLYGTTSRGTPADAGLVFSIRPGDAAPVPIHAFPASQTGTSLGLAPTAVIVSDGVLYGAAENGEPLSAGAVFRVGVDGADPRVLHPFDFTDSVNGSLPRSKLLRIGTQLYGTTNAGGSHEEGTIYRLNIDGSGFQVLHSFSAAETGSGQTAALIQGSDGFLYGTARIGGASGKGTIFRLHPDGSQFAVLHSFEAEGNPFSALVEDEPGVFYGTAPDNAGADLGLVFSLDVNTTPPTFTVLHRFERDSPEGFAPWGALVRGAGGWFYGTSSQGGSFSFGAAFAISRWGEIRAVAAFDHVHGAFPRTALTLMPDGSFYGTTGEGGELSGGTIFRIAADTDGDGVLDGIDDCPLSASETCTGLPPVADEQSIVTSEDTAVAVVLTASDPDSPRLTFTIESGPAHGMLTGVAPTLTYVPNADYHGADTFSFTASDGTAASNVAIVTIVVTPVNDVPTAESQSLLIDEDTAVPLRLQVADADGDALTFTVSAPGFGMLTGVAPDLVYTPPPNFAGTDGFTYTVHDGTTSSSTAAVTITVRPVDDPPVSSDDRYTVQQGSTLMSGTVRLESFSSTHGGVPLRQLTDVNGTLFFQASHPSKGSGLWATDGTVPGTRLVHPGVTEHLANVGGRLFFGAGSRLWTSDGTSAGTIELKAFPSTPFGLTDVGGRLFFLITRASASGDLDGQELWTSDGTAEGTTLLKWLNPGFQAAVYPLYPTNLNGLLMLRVRSAAGEFALWKSDGTAEGTVPVKAVVAGNTSFLDPLPNTLVNVDGTLFFAALDQTSAQIDFDVWKSDGTAEGTVEIKDVEPSAVSIPLEMTNVAGTLFFMAYVQLPDGEQRQLWKSDGTPAGTTLLRTFAPMSGFFDEPWYLTGVNGTLFFKGPDGLWKTDGTSDGTVLVRRMGVADACGGQPCALTRPRLFAAAGDRLFFQGRQVGSDGPDELWASDGSPDGTVLVKNVAPGTATDIKDLTPSGALVYFSHDLYPDPPLLARELWASGTANNLLANDVDPDGGAAAVTLVTGPTSGTLSLNADGTFAYRPHAWFRGVDQFTYRVTTGALISNDATVTIDVTPAPPVVSVGDVSVFEGTGSSPTTAMVPVTLSAPTANTVTVHFATTDGSAATADGDYIGRAGILTFQPGQTSREVELTITADTRVEPDEAFSLRLTTATNATVGDGYAVLVLEDDDDVTEPVAEDQSVSVDEDAAKTITLTATDPRGAPLTYTVVNPPAHGVLSGSAPDLVYTPLPNYSGPDQFTFRVSNATTVSDVATVSIAVVAINDPPTQSIPDGSGTATNWPLLFAASSGNPISIADVDAGGSPVRVTIEAVKGTVTLLGRRGLTFVTGDGNADETIVFTASIADANTALAAQGLVFTPLSGFTGFAGFTITTDDQGNTGAGGPRSVRSTVVVWVGPDATAALGVGMNGTPSRLAVGESLTYSISVWNHGILTATSVTLASTLSADVTFVSATGGNCSYVSAFRIVSCDLGAIERQAIKEVTIVVRPKTKGWLTNRVAVFANQSDPDLRDNFSSLHTRVQ